MRAAFGQKRTLERANLIASRHSRKRTPTVGGDSVPSACSESGANSSSKGLRRIAFDSHYLLSEIHRPGGPNLKGIDPGVGL